MKTPTQKDICTSMFIAALFTIAKIWKQPECSLMDERVKKMYIYIHIYTHTHIYIYIHTYIYTHTTYTTQNGILLFYSAKKRMKFCHL